MIMYVPKPPKITISATKRLFRMSRDQWTSGLLPVSRLPIERDLYVALAERAGGKYREVYQPMVDALDRAIAEVTRK